MRLGWQAVAGGSLVLAVGAAGLIRGAVPQAPAADPGASPTDPITVSGAYVRPPLPPNSLAGAYFTVRNNTDRPDELLDIQTGAGAKATLHRVDSSGAMSATGTATIPAHGTLALTVGKAHVMIEQLFGPLKAGQRVNISLNFQDAGPVDVVAPVVAYGTNPPGVS